MLFLNDYDVMLCKVFGRKDNPTGNEKLQVVCFNRETPPMIWKVPRICRVTKQSFPKFHNFLNFETF